METNFDHFLVVSNHFLWRRERCLHYGLLVIELCEEAGSIVAEVLLPKPVAA